MSGALTKAEQVKEILKCGKDPVYFLNTYARIQHPTQGRIPFKTYDFQDDVLHDIEKNRFNIILKSRQLGLSTIAAGYAVWYAIFYRDKNILVIATKLDTAMNFIKKVKTILKSLPAWLLLPSFEDNKRSVTFNNGSQITAVPTSEDAGRSEALSLLIVDEAAFIRNFDDLWTGLYPTISTGGRALVISTPNGVGGMYYRLWTGAEAGNNEFNAVRLPWTVHPEHDDVWFQTETRNFSKRKIAQEYLCDFIASGDTFLQIDDLNWLREQIRPPMEKAGDDRKVWIWKHPEAGRRYVISADVARGDAGDYSTWHAIDADSCEVVAEYMGKIPPEKLADMLAEFGRKYNTALVCPENNTFGYFTNTKLRDDGYPKLFYMGHHGDPFEFISNDPDALPGFSTQTKTRTQILAKLEELIRNKQLLSYSQRLYDQLQAFIWSGSKPMALKDAHDDLIMSVAIGAWIIGGGHGLSAHAINMATAMLNASSVSRTNQSDLPGGIDTVKPLVNPAISGVNPRNVHKPRSPEHVRHVDISDFSWLLR